MGMMMVGGKFLIDEQNLIRGSDRLIQSLAPFSNPKTPELGSINSLLRWLGLSLPQGQREPKGTKKRAPRGKDERREVEGARIHRRTKPVFQNNPWQIGFIINAYRCA